MKRFADTFYFLALLSPNDRIWDHRLVHALTGDRHFERAGFVAMLQ